MPHAHQLLELTDHELSSVTGGFLPLLGLLGMGANLAGSIMGSIGQSKAKEAQQITAAAGQGQAAAQGQPGAPGAAPAPAASGDLLAPRAPASGGGQCGCGASS